MRHAALGTLFLLVSAAAFAHAGEVHTYMGTVTAVLEDGSFTIETTDGRTLPIATTETTVYRRSGGEAATAAEVLVGTRVVVRMAKDGKTATLVKIGRKSS